MLDSTVRNTSINLKNDNILSNTSSEYPTLPPRSLIQTKESAIPALKALLITGGANR